MRSNIDKLLGEVDIEFNRTFAETLCCSILRHRGWDVGFSDTKAPFDVFATKGKKNIKIQVRSSKVTTRNGAFPKFRVGKVTYNRKECKRSFFKKGLFDYWFFYSSVTGEYWLIPFKEINQIAEVSMQQFEKWKGGRVV